MMGLETILTMGFTIVLKLLEFFLDRSKLSKEQSKALLDLIKESQKVPVSSTKIAQMLSRAEDDILEQERKILEGK